MRWKIILILLIISLIVLFFLFSQEAGGLKNRQTEIQPVEITPSSTVSVFFGNTNNDPDVLNCGTTYPTSRQIKSEGDKYLAVLAELLNGPTNTEKDQGFFTAINSGIKLPDLVLSDGVMTVNFAADIETAVGGSCRVAAIRSQIENTLKQFTEIKEVVIAVDGRVADALQP